jgi:hypothetical protein
MLATEVHAIDFEGKILRGHLALRQGWPPLHPIFTRKDREPRVQVVGALSAPTT